MNTPFSSASSGLPASGAAFTQVELAERVGETQSFVSKCERGERRFDVIELRTS